MIHHGLLNLQFFLESVDWLCELNCSSHRTVALKRHKSQKSELCQGLNSHYFHIIGYGGMVINPIVGVYILIIRIPIMQPA